jgi:hypothetical protein
VRVVVRRAKSWSLHFRSVASIPKLLSMRTSACIHVGTYLQIPPARNHPIKGGLGTPQMRAIINPFFFFWPTESLLLFVQSGFVAQE